MYKLFITALIFCMPVLCFAQHKKEEQEVQSVIVRFFDGLSALNDDKIRAEVMDDFVLLEDGMYWNTDSLLRAISPMKNVSFTRKNNFIFYKTDLRKDVAWVSYDNVADVTVNGRPMKWHWLESVVVVKTRNGWKLAQMHSTPIRTRK